MSVSRPPPTCCRKVSGRKRAHQKKSSQTTGVHQSFRATSRCPHNAMILNYSPRALGLCRTLVQYQRSALVTPRITVRHASLSAIHRGLRQSEKLQYGSVRPVRSSRTDPKERSPRPERADRERGGRPERMDRGRGDRSEHQSDRTFRAMAGAATPRQKQKLRQKLRRKQERKEEPSNCIIPRQTRRARFRDPDSTYGKTSVVYHLKHGKLKDMAENLDIPEPVRPRTFASIKRDQRSSRQDVGEDVASDEKRPRTFRSDVSDREPRTAERRLGGGVRTRDESRPPAKLGLERRARGLAPRSKSDFERRDGAASESRQRGGRRDEGSPSEFRRSSDRSDRGTASESRRSPDRNDRDTASESRQSPDRGDRGTASEFRRSPDRNDRGTSSEARRGSDRRDGGATPEDRRRSDDRESASPYKNMMAMTIKYTTAASQFLYGRSVVKAALEQSRRKIYHLYIQGSENRKDNTDNAVLSDLAKQQGVRVTIVPGEEQRLMDKMSKGRPHNGFVLETSPLPQLPVVSLGQLEETSFKLGFHVVLDRQTREEETINGSETLIRRANANKAKPFVMLLHEILDPGNLGAALRTASYLGVDAIGITNRSSAALTPVVLKSATGAAEEVTIFTVDAPQKFLEESRAAGWKTYAAVPPPDPQLMRKHSDKFISTDVVEQNNPLDRDPCILVMGNEGHGLPKNIKMAADYELSIPRFLSTSSIDSLNVSVAAGLLCHAFVRKSPTDKPGATSLLGLGVNVPRSVSSQMQDMRKRDLF